MTSDEYIEKYTKRCSNEINYDEEKLYSPWLSPDNAKSAVMIGKEELIEAAREWICDNLCEYIMLTQDSNDATYDPKIIDDFEDFLKTKI